MPLQLDHVEQRTKKKLVQESLGFRVSDGDCWREVVMLGRILSSSSTQSHFRTTRLFRRPYFRPRSNALEGMFVASFVGVCSGYYIFKPLLDEIAANQAARKQREALEAAAAGGSNAAAVEDQKKAPKA